MGIILGFTVGRGKRPIWDSLGPCSWSDRDVDKSLRDAIKKDELIRMYGGDPEAEVHFANYHTLDRGLDRRSRHDSKFVWRGMNLTEKDDRSRKSDYAYEMEYDRAHMTASEFYTKYKYDE